MAFTFANFSSRPFNAAVAGLRSGDPQGKRLREALKRAQLLGQKEAERKGPFTRMMQTLQDLYNDSMVFRTVCGPVAARVMGLPLELMVRFYTEEEARRANKMSFDELAQEALAVTAN